MNSRARQPAPAAPSCYPIPTPESSTQLLSDTYTRDKLGRISRQIEAIGGTTDTYTYSYDVAGRLTDVFKDGSLTAHYSYDANGNRTTSTGPGGVSLTASYDAQDRLSQNGSTTYTYTSGGWLASKTSGGKTTSYRYDALGNLRGVTLPDGTQISYVVDGMNRRIGKKVNGALVQGFLYEGMRPVAELDGNNQVVSRFVYGSMDTVPDYLIKGGSTYRILSDHLGSPRLVVDTSSGQVVQQLDYDAYGNVVQDTNPGFQPFGFGGGLYDRDTKLVRFGARDYDAETGRWAARDPLLFGGGDTNLYSYALDDPVNFADPLGLTPRDWADFASGFGDTLSPNTGALLFGPGLGDIMGRVVGLPPVTAWLRKKTHADVCVNMDSSAYKWGKVFAAMLALAIGGLAAGEGSVPSAGNPAGDAVDRAAENFLKQQLENVSQGTRDALEEGVKSTGSGPLGGNDGYWFK